MTTIKLTDKTIEIADGLDVRMDGDKITIDPKPLFVPQFSTAGIVSPPFNQAVTTTVPSDTRTSQFRQNPDGSYTLFYGGSDDPKTS